jgi:hypothetical protein
MKTLEQFKKDVLGCEKTEVCPCSVSEEPVPMNKKLPLKEEAVEAP